MNLEFIIQWLWPRKGNQVWKIKRTKKALVKRLKFVCKAFEKRLQSIWTAFGMRFISLNSFCNGLFKRVSELNNFYIFYLVNVFLRMNKMQETLNRNDASALACSSFHCKYIWFSAKPLMKCGTVWGCWWHSGSACLSPMWLGFDSGSVQLSD